MPSEPLYDDLASGLRDARGGRRKAQPLDVEVVRAVTEEDLPKLEDRSLVPASGPITAISLKSLRAGHHQVARLLAEGRPGEEVSLLTGYSPAYISTLKSDPTFRELLSYYEQNKVQAHVDLIERMKTLGLSTLDELQRRLEEESDSWTKRELMDLAKMLLPNQSGESPAQSVGPRSNVPLVNISFITPDGGSASKFIELEPNK